MVIKEKSSTRSDQSSEIKLPMEKMVTLIEIGNEINVCIVGPAVSRFWINPFFRDFII